jgi:hypothetical protein
MNHDALAHAICGHYTAISDGSGYIESPLAFPVDGTLIGAYVLEAGPGRFVVTDDGDVAFHVAAAGAEITPSRIKAYRSIAEEHGLSLNDEGVISVTCGDTELTSVLSQYLQAASAIATKGLKHRPRDEERFTRIVGDALANKYGERLRKRVEVTGLSGHQIRFPFALDMGRDRCAYVQPIAADANVIQWKAVYEAGGKFKDLRSARKDAPIIAVLEASRDADRASGFFADTAATVIYQGGAINLDFALAA